MNEVGNDVGFYMIFGIVIVFLLVVLIVAFARWVHEFRRELRCLNADIRRTQGKEQEHWIQMRRKLWLSILPFVRY